MAGTQVEGAPRGPRLTVVIPTWNRKDLVVECLECLGRQTLRGFEIVVVDDGSTDGTAHAIAERFPHMAREDKGLQPLVPSAERLPRVRVVRLPENRGFCVAANTGIRHASGDLILLLNNDVFAEPGFLERLVEAADSSRAAMFAPLLVWRAEPEVIYSAGDAQFASGRPESVGFRHKLEGFDFPRAIFGVSAGAGLYRREVFERVGLLDEGFGAYFEDSDLSFRARLAGFEAAFVPEAVARHIGSASIEDRTWWRTRQCYRNHALLVLKNMPLSLLLRHARPILAERLHQTRRLFSAARCEFGSLRAACVFAGAWLSIRRQVPHCLIERYKIQRRRAITPGELEALFSK